MHKKTDTNTHQIPINTHPFNPVWFPDIEHFPSSSSQNNWETSQWLKFYYIWCRFVCVCACDVQNNTWVCFKTSFFTQGQSLIRLFFFFTRADSNDVYFGLFLVWFWYQYSRQIADILCYHKNNLEQIAVLPWLFIAQSNKHTIAADSLNDTVWSLNLFTPAWKTTLKSLSWLWTAKQKKKKKTMLGLSSVKSLFILIASLILQQLGLSLFSIQKEAKGSFK